MATKTSPRDGFLACVRARRILDAIDFLRFGSSDAEYEGSATEGFYAHHDGSGNHHVIAWSADGVVALDFDHEGADLEHHVPEKDRDPGRWLEGLVGLDALRDRVTEYADKRATGGLWIRGATVHRDGETDQLDPYLLEVRGALEAWNAVVELSSEDLDLVAALESTSRRKAIKLTKAQQQRLLDRGDDVPPATPRGAEMAAKVLAQLGIAWPEAKTKAAATKLTASEKAAAKLGAPQVALLEAVHARDLEATRAALDAGASPDCRTYKGQFADVYFVESPLVMATRTGDEAVALLLIERGAAMDEIDGVGMNPALYWALLRGRVRVVRELLARGVVPPTGLDAMSYVVEGARMLGEERMRAFLGSAADFAGCLRVLLEAGAPLLDTSLRRGLIQIAMAGGAEDLVPRFKVRPPNPQHAEHTLPPEPPLPALPSVNGSREDLLGLLRRATDRMGDPIGARTALMGAWRLTRNPRIADAIEVWDGTSGGGDRLARSGPGREQLGAPMIVQGFDSALVIPAQPIAAREALEFVERGGVGCVGCFERCLASAAAVLVHVADVRTFQRFRRAVHDSPRADWDLVGAPRALVDAVALVAGFRPADLDEEASALLARVEDVAAGRSLAPPSVTPVSDLFRAVHAQPGDDAPRCALAERLSAVGDPRGEFITLQLERHASGGPPTKREHDLAREHGRAWLGDIAWAVRDEALAFERGFVARATAGRRHEDLKSWHLGFSAPAKFGDEDEWSTIEKLSAGWHGKGTSGLLLSPKLRSLREVVDVLPCDLDQVLAGVPRSWKCLGTFMTRSTDWWLGPQHAARLEALPDVMPELRRLSFAARDLSGDLVARVVARLPRLQDLSLAYRWDGLSELVAIAADHDLRTARLLLLRIGKQQQMMFSPGDLAVDVDTRVITVEIPGRLHDSVAQGSAFALRGAAEMRPTALAVALPPGAQPEGQDAESPELPASFVRRKERMSLAPLWAVGRSLGIPCSVGPELVPHWSPCEEALQ